MVGGGERRRARPCSWRIECRPDVVVMDISMPGMNGLVGDAEAEAGLPDAAVVTLTRHADDAYLQELLRAGVSGYVLKQSPPAELLQAIRGGGRRRPVPRFRPDRAGDRAASSAEEGKRPSARATHHRTRGGSAAADRVRLQQQGDRRAARSLSVKTVEAHKANAMRKLDLTGRIDIVKYAILQGWLENA